jgi:hypothetical protein
MLEGSENHDGLVKMTTNDNVYANCMSFVSNGLQAKTAVRNIPNGFTELGSETAVGNVPVRTGNTNTTTIQPSLEDSPKKRKVIPFWTAFTIPVRYVPVLPRANIMTSICPLHCNRTLQGMAEYCISLFMVKLVTYTFLFWLPKYIQETGINWLLIIITSTQFRMFIQR